MHFAFYANRLLDGFCRPSSVYSHDVVGKYMPCAAESGVVATNAIALIAMLLRLRHLFDSNDDVYMLRSRLTPGVSIVIASIQAFLPIFLLVSRMTGMISEDLFLHSGTDIPPFEVVSYVLASVTWVTLAVLLSVEINRYKHSGAGVVRFLLVLMLAAMLPKLRYATLDWHRPTTYLFMVDMLGHIYFAAWALFYMPSSLSQPLSGGGRMEYGALSGSDADEGYVTLAGVDNPDVTAGVCPERRSNLVQCMLFSWVTPVMHTGHNRPLRDEDVWSLDDNDRSATVFRKFQAAWSAEFQKAEPSLMRALWVCYGVRFMLVGTLFKMVNDLSQFVGPLALNALLSSLERGQPLRESFVYGVAIFVGLIGGTLAENQYFQKVMRVGYQLRSSITSALFLKSLHMSPSVSEEIASKGKITNLVSSDVEQLQATCQNFHNIWSSPLRIVISMVLLYQQLGIASVVGLLVLLLVLPIQALVMRRIAFLSKTMMGKSDERVKLLSEILSAMDVVKCYVWEGSFQEKVSAIRTEELKWLRKNSYLVALNFFVIGVIPVLVSVLTFAAYIACGGELTATKAFVSLSLFSVLRAPLFVLPSTITQITQSLVSITRIQEVLCAKEQTSERSTSPPRLDTGAPSIEISAGNFSWDLQEYVPYLQDINLRVQRGELVAVVGATGQGKSSLIQAILGEMLEVRSLENPGTLAPGTSAVTVRGKVAYVAQSAWIFNASVRDNILFGQPFYRERYQRALAVSCLLADLEHMPGGDAAEIGERGVNLSGGQKQRISIARAVYADADIYLFDDPLSALDSHVGREVLEKCILGQLRHKTRLMVTNQLQFLPSFDVVVVLHKGHVMEAGPYEQLMASGTYLPAMMKDTIAEGEPPAPPEGGAVAGGGASRRNSGKGAAKGAIDAAEEEYAEIKKSPRGPVKAKSRTPATAALVQQEERVTGGVTLATIRHYTRAMGGAPAVALLAVTYILTEVLRVAASVWLTLWSAQATPAPSPPGPHPTLSAPFPDASSFSPSFLGSSPASTAGSLANLPLAASWLDPSGAFSSFSRWLSSWSLLLPLFHGLENGIHRIGSSVHADSGPFGAYSLNAGGSIVGADGSSEIVGPGDGILGPEHGSSSSGGSSSYFFNILGGGDSPMDYGSYQWLAAAVKTVGFYLAVYSGLSLAQIVLTFVNQFYLSAASVRASETLHRSMLAAVLRAPMAFFHGNPLGRVLNRFTKDISDVDRNLANFSSIFLRGFAQLASTLVLIAAATPFSVLFFVPMFFAFQALYEYFQRVAREVKRLDSISRSPVYSLISESLSGLATIRAYGAQSRLLAQQGDLLDTNIRFSLLSMSANRWLSVRLEALGAFIVLVTASMALAQGGGAPVVGLIISYALSITSLLTMTLRLASVAESSFNAVERIAHYTAVEPEAPAVIDACRPPPGWPSQGAISFESVSMRYRPDLPPVLQGLTASIRAGEKVGVVGRTGAGKSSLFSALFRLVEVDGGRIVVDDVDVARLGLADLRRGIGIIPQQPVLFTGTIRFNLDPFGMFSEGAIWQAIGRAHMGEVIKSLPHGLSSQVQEGGKNFSAGQRQLLSLARAVLTRPRILVLDEATAAVDQATDALIQKTIREEFKSCTMLIIAHRLNTIIDCDRIMVMADGSLVENDRPSALLAKDNGVFSSMVRATGPSTERFLRQVAAGEMDMDSALVERILDASGPEDAEADAKVRWVKAVWRVTTSQLLGMPNGRAGRPPAGSSSSMSAGGKLSPGTLSLIVRDGGGGPGSPRFPDGDLVAEDGGAVFVEGSLLHRVNCAASLLADTLRCVNVGDVRRELEARGVEESRWNAWFARVIFKLNELALAMTADGPRPRLTATPGEGDAVWSDAHRLLSSTIN